MLNLPVLWLQSHVQAVLLFFARKFSTLGSRTRTASQEQAAGNKRLSSAAALMMAWMVMQARKIIITSDLETWQETVLLPLAAIAPQRPNWQILCLMIT